jgi:uncharacterized protein
MSADITQSAQNKRLLQDIFAELAQGNSKPFVECMSDDFQWTLTGSTKWSRTYNGKQAVLSELFAPLRAKLAGRITVTAHRFIAEGDFVVVELRGNNTTKTGMPYNNSYCYIVRIADGKLRELTEYTDTELVATALGDPDR